jgi:pimeloyl-ACP methyl ester carboxylesterase
MKIDRCTGSIVSIPFGKHKIDALFHQAAPEKLVDEELVILRIHGLMGNLLDESEFFLPEALAHRGYASITMNTLLANLGLFFGFGVFDDAMDQISSVCEYLKEQGFRKIVIAGHGLGGCMAIRFGSMISEQDRLGIKGIIAIATPYSFPESIRRKWDRNESEPSYLQIEQKAREFLQSRSPEDLTTDEIFAVQRAHGKSRLPQDSELFTYKTWSSLAGPNAEGAKTHKHIGAIKVPLLIIHALEDQLIEKSEADSLVQIATDAGNPKVTKMLLNADHTFDEKHAELADVIERWLSDE